MNCWLSFGKWDLLFRRSIGMTYRIYSNLIVPGVSVLYILI